MTVKVTLPGGTTHEYMRFGDSYVEHRDGTLEVIRRGNKHPRTYAAGEWAKVHGDQNHRWRGRP